MDGDTAPKDSDRPESSNHKADGAAVSHEKQTPAEPRHEALSGDEHQRFSPGTADDDWTRMYDTDGVKPVEVKPISWTASEFIAHEKSFNWYLILGVITVVVSALVYILTKDVISTIAIVVVAIVFGYAATRKPRTLPYKLDGETLTIDTKVYPYSQFRSFAVFEDGAFSSLIFMPLKRFMPIIEIYYEPKDEEQIVQLLADRLPMEAHTLDPIERLMRHIRF